MARISVSTAFLIMPVEDHAIHPSTQKGEDFRYGCWNRPDEFKDSYWAAERRYFPDGSFEPVSVSVPFRMTHKCRHDGVAAMGIDDPACEGCRLYKENK